jgi:hypothetical protein
MGYRNHALCDSCYKSCGNQVFHHLIIWVVFWFGSDSNIFKMKHVRGRVKAAWCPSHDPRRIEAEGTIYACSMACVSMGSHNGFTTARWPRGHDWRVLLWPTARPGMRLKDTNGLCFSLSASRLRAEVFFSCSHLPIIYLGVVVCALTLDGNDRGFKPRAVVLCFAATALCQVCGTMRLKNNNGC